MRTEFQDIAAEKSLGQLMSEAEQAYFLYAAMKNPQQQMYTRFAKAADACIDKFVETYPSIQSYIDEKESKLCAELDRQKTPHASPVIDFGVEGRAMLERINLAIYSGEKYVRDDFTAIVVMQVPLVYEKAHAMLVKQLVQKVVTPSSSVSRRPE